MRPHPSMPTAVDNAERTPLSRPVRGLLVAFGVLTALAVVALLAGAEHTDDAFAWTITPPLGAAFLGAAYGAGCLLVLLTLRAGTWEQARWPLVTVLVFVVLTLLATLLHLDRLHLPGTTDLGTSAGWFWLTVYVVLPPVMGTVILREELAHRPGGRRPHAAPATRTARQPPAFTGSLLAQGVVLGAAGLALLVQVAPVVDRWPWALTPFLGRVTAAWLLAFAVAAFLAARVEVSLLGPASVAYAAFGALELFAVALHRGDLRTGGPAVACVVVAAWILLTGVWGVWLAHAGAHDDA